MVVTIEKWVWYLVGGVINVSALLASKKIERTSA